MKIGVKSEHCAGAAGAAQDAQLGGCTESKSTGIELQGVGALALGWVVVFVACYF
jgi:hypothetical protein